MMASLVSPGGSDGDGENPPWKRRAAFAEINGRRINEAIERGTSGPAPVFVCECGHPSCTAAVSLAIEDYAAVRIDFDRFLLVPGHEIEGLDQVVESHGDYLVVVKRGREARRMAQDADERS
jgi:hypothetical protein